MEKILEQSLLFDFYGELLTPYQKSIYEDFVLNDLSLGEIAAEQDISRQAVYDIIKRCNKKLGSYEEKLHLIDRFVKAKESVGEIHRMAGDILLHPEDHVACIEHVETIEKLCDALMDEL